MQIINAPLPTTARTASILALRCVAAATVAQGCQAGQAAADDEQEDCDEDGDAALGSEKGKAGGYL